MTRSDPILRRKRSGFYKIVRVIVTRALFGGAGLGTAERRSYRPAMAGGQSRAWDSARVPSTAAPEAARREKRQAGHDRTEEAQPTNIQLAPGLPVDASLPSNPSNRGATVRGRLLARDWLCIHEAELERPLIIQPAARSGRQNGCDFKSGGSVARYADAKVDGKYLCFHGAGGGI